jgi:acetyl esterase/lipase
VRKIDDRKIDLTFYPAAGDGPRGTVIVCPGGAYRVLAAHEGDPICRWLNRAGLPAFLLRYSVAPRRHPAPLEDASRAVRVVRSRAAEFGVRPDKIGILGFSAGGHLAATLATHFDAGYAKADDPVDRASSRPDALIACYAITSLLTFRDKDIDANFFGPACPPSRKTLEDLSNELHVSPATPPTFLWHTAEDEIVPVEQSIMFAQSLRRHDVPFELHIFPHGRHGLGLGDGSSFVGASPGVAQWTGLCRNWLMSLGFLESPT